MMGNMLRHEFGAVQRVRKAVARRGPRGMVSPVAKRLEHCPDARHPPFHMSCVACHVLHVGTHDQDSG